MKLFLIKFLVYGLLVWLFSWLVTITATLDIVGFFVGLGWCVFGFLFIDNLYNIIFWIIDFIKNNQNGTNSA